MRNRGAGEHPQRKDSRITVTFSRHEELPAGTSARKRKRKAGRNHTREIPEALRMCDGLVGKSGFELAQDHISNCRGDYQGNKSGEKVEVPEENEVPKRSHCAEPAALSNESDDQADPERNKKRRMHGPWAFDTVKQYIGFGLTGFLRIQEEKRQESQGNEGKD
jgi:hypothetical protein